MRWTREDNDAACKQHWGLYTWSSGGGVAIEDTRELSGADRPKNQQALALVTRLADEGDALALKAFAVMAYVAMTGDNRGVKTLTPPARSIAAATSAARSCTTSQAQMEKEP